MTWDVSCDAGAQARTAVRYGRAEGREGRRACTAAAKQKAERRIARRSAFDVLIKLPSHQAAGSSDWNTSAKSSILLVGNDLLEGRTASAIVSVEYFAGYTFPTIRNPHPNFETACCAASNSPCIWDNRVPHRETSPLTH
jgi:hypothetical protein